MNVLELKKLKDGCPVMVAHIPIQIQNEIKLWVYECSKIKEHPLGPRTNAVKLKLIHC